GYAQRQAGSPVAPGDFSRLVHGGPALELTPLATWRQILERHSRLRDSDILEYKAEVFGYPPLREAYASYLIRARAVNCSADQVVVFSARELRLDIVCRLLIDPGDWVAVENPGYPTPRRTLHACGANIAAIPVDMHGIDVDHLIDLPQQIKLVYVTPSHNSPTGAVLPLERRRKLLAWAERTGAFIIEDDYDSEFRYVGRPLPSLQGLDSSDSVILLSCAWRILSPVQKLGFMVAPHCLKEALALAKTHIERYLPLLDQHALTDFINEGHLERNIRKLRGIYAQRRKCLVDALGAHLGKRVKTAPESAGLELMVQLQSGLTDEQIESLASEAGLPIVSSRPYYVGNGRRGEFIIPFNKLDRRALETAVEQFARLLGASSEA
ncbi:MAG: PLP-dependent aminotransferase family protein, partial [Chloroflexi bacterium]|nr:PLP-dependent aminotransferase family protein [Chloroflexota bacterium]